MIFVLMETSITKMNTRRMLPRLIPQAFDMLPLSNISLTPDIDFRGKTLVRIIAHGMVSQYGQQDYYDVKNSFGWCLDEFNLSKVTCAIYIRR
jgi:hypothetical protein